MTFICKKVWLKMSIFISTSFFFHFKLIFNQLVILEFSHFLKSIIHRYDFQVYNNIQSPRRAKWKFNASIHLRCKRISFQIIIRQYEGSATRYSYASLRKTIHDVDTATCNALNERIRIRHARERSCMPLSMLVDQVFFLRFSFGYLFARVTLSLFTSVIFRKWPFFLYKYTKEVFVRFDVSQNWKGDSSRKIINI